MGIFDSIIGGLLGGNTAPGPIQSVLGSIMGGGGGAQPGVAGLIQRFTDAGHGAVANSWVGNGANQPAEPGMLQQVFGQGQVNQWAQQTGMAPHDLLGQLAQFLPHAVDSMTPNGQIPAGGSFDGAGSNLGGGSSSGSSPFDEAGVDLGGGTRRT